MKQIGITGPTGSGKTTALMALEKLGVCVLDADAIYYELLEHNREMKQELLERFGAGILNSQGGIDRKQLGAIVFADANALLDLNAITHKYVTMETDRRKVQAEAEGAKGVAVDAIALIESGIGKSCDKIVSILAPAEVRVKRIMARDGISEEYARSRINAQKPDSFYTENSDHVLLNDGSLTPEEFEQQALEYFKTIL